MREGEALFQEMANGLPLIIWVHVTLASTGSDALDILQRDDKDLVLCDIGLPGMSGYDVARTVQGT